MSNTTIKCNYSNPNLNIGDTSKYLSVVNLNSESKLNKNSKNLEKFLKSNMNLFGFIIILLIGITSCLVLVKCSLEENTVFLSVPNNGELIGSIGYTARTNQKIFQFLGIPYAESPGTSNRRFKAPVARQPWHKSLDVTKYGRECPEITRIAKLSKNELTEDLEDCLNLCVYTKNFNTSKAVMFYIHGGGFVNGSAKDHPPNYLLENDIVLVVAQFRIGPFGYLSTRTTEIPGNAAVLDILLALNWVQDNIHHFGGDPNQVTVFGQSAGAAITSLLTISPAVREGLFHRAIVQSGSILANWAIEDDPIEIAKTACMKVGCANCTTTLGINYCLEKVSTVKLIKESPSIFFKLTSNDLNGILPEKPKDLIKKVKKKYQIMGGVTKHDGSYVLTVFYDKLGHFLGDFSQISPRTILPKMVELCDGEDNHGNLYNFILKSLFTTKELNGNNSKILLPKLIELATILVFKSPLLHYVDLMTPKSESQNYLYTFDYTGQYTRFGYEMGTKQYPFNGGVHHSDDNLYLFPYPYNALNSQDSIISQLTVDIWTSFAIAGKPSSNLTLTELMPVTTGTGPYFKINKQVEVGEDYLDEFFVSNDSQNLIR